MSALRPPSWLAPDIVIRWIGRLGSNTSQVAVTVMVAGLLAAATWSLGLATSGWQSSTRAEIRSNSAVTEQVRHVYLVEAPIAMTITRLLIRADSFAASGAAFRAESATLTKAAEQLKTSHSSRVGLLAEQYRGEGHEYLVNRRLGDLIVAEQRPDLVSRQTLAREADNLALRAYLLAAAGVLVAMTFIAARLIAGTTRSRQSAASAESDVALVPQPWAETGHRQRTSSVALVAWLLLPLLSSAQIFVSAQAARDDAEATRLAERTTAHIVTGSLHSTLELQALAATIELTELALARAQVAPSTSDPDYQLATSVADVDASQKWEEVSARMTAGPVAADGVDATTRSMIVSSPADWSRLAAEQNTVVDRAQTRGDAVNLLGLALLLAGLAATTAAVARIAGTARRPVVVVAVVLNATATLAAGGALVLAL